MSARVLVDGVDVCRILRTELDTARFEVRVAGRPVLLTAQEFAILETVYGRGYSLAEGCNSDAAGP